MCDAIGMRLKSYMSFSVNLNQTNTMFYKICNDLF